MPFSRESSQSRGQTQASCVVSRFFTIRTTQEALLMLSSYMLITLSTYAWLEIRSKYRTDKEINL